MNIHPFRFQTVHDSPEGFLRIAFLQLQLKLCYLNTQPRFFHGTNQLKLLKYDAQLANN